MNCHESLPEVDTTENIPMILSPQLHDIFPIFSSMLDAKSFMKLAMTSKQMYKRCMEDKSIKINVVGDSVSGHKADDWRCNSAAVSHCNMDCYLSSLAKMPCSVTLRCLEINLYELTSTTNMLESARRYLAKIRVKGIDKLRLYDDFDEWDGVIPFMKDFHVNFLSIVSTHGRHIPHHTLLSLLQLNLKEFSYNGHISVDLLFEVSSPIPKLSLTGMNNIPKDKFMQVLWMIQTGSLTNLTIPFNAVDWSAFDKLPFNHQAAIPDDRPLLFARTPEGSEIHEYWFLHWQGGVTKCVWNPGILEVFKCEPSGLPIALRKEDDIMKDLTEMRSGISCQLKHFRAFVASLEMFDPSFKGPLPSERPLYFKTSANSFWRLDEGDNLVNYSWESGCFTGNTLAVNGNTYTRFVHPALAKYMFWKLLKQNPTSSFGLYCEGGKDGFNSWFEDCKTFDLDYTGPLPKDRPVVFGGNDSKTRVVLFDYVRFQCKLDGKRVNIKHCSSWEKCLNTQMSDYDLLRLLGDTSRGFGNAYVKTRVSLKTFRAGLALHSRPNDHCPPFTCTTTKKSDGRLIVESWYRSYGKFGAAVWDDGILVRTPGDLREFPSECRKIIFKYFSRETFGSMDPVFLELEQFRSCLEQFTVVPFDYSGPLKNDSPLVFVKDEIRHICDVTGTPTLRCPCSDGTIHVCFFWEDMRTTYCSWGEEEPQRIRFKAPYEYELHVPPFLKSKECLTMLLKIPYIKGIDYKWYGDFDEFLTVFNEYKKFNYEGDLPEERPLVLEHHRFHQEPIRFLLREDNSVVKCDWLVDYAVFSSANRHIIHTPRILWQFI